MFRPCKDVKVLISTDNYNLNIHPETAYINSDLNSGIQKKDKVNLGQKWSTRQWYHLKTHPWYSNINHILGSCPVASKILKVASKFKPRSSPTCWSRKLRTDSRFIPLMVLKHAKTNKNPWFLHWEIQKWWELMGNYTRSSGFESLIFLTGYNRDTGMLGARGSDPKFSCFNRYSWQTLAMFHG